MSQYLLCLRLPPSSVALSHVTPCRRISGQSAELLPPLPSLLLPHPTKDHSSLAQGFASRDPDLRHQSTCKLTLSTSPRLLNPNFSTVSCTFLGWHQQTLCLPPLLQRADVWTLPTVGLCFCTGWSLTLSTRLLLFSLSPCLPFSDTKMFLVLVWNSQHSATSQTLAARDQLISSKARLGFQMFFLMGFLISDGEPSLGEERVSVSWKAPACSWLARTTPAVWDLCPWGKCSALLAECQKSHGPGKNRPHYNTCSRMTGCG